LPKKESTSRLPVTIRKDLPPIALYPFTKFFNGFEKVQAVRDVFGGKTESVLAAQKVEFVSSKFAYMGVNPDDGHILVGTYHLKNSQPKILYLDLIHELFHVRQFLEGKNLFPEGVEYVDSPIEVPAYRHTVSEAKRIGMSFKEIEEYLMVEWINEEQHQRLVKACGVTPSMKVNRHGQIPDVQITRTAPLILYPFTRFFAGFEKVEVVSSLFGRETDEVLANLRVEFFSPRWGYIGVNDEDGHIIAGAKYVRDTDPQSLYLDLVFALHDVKRFLEGRPLFGARWGISEDHQTFDAYRSTVAEARRLGMSNPQIVEYLRDEWIPAPQFSRLLKEVGLAEGA
jgi:hypothetical protein